MANLGSIHCIVLDLHSKRLSTKLGAPNERGLAVNFFGLGQVGERIFS